MANANRAVALFYRTNGYGLAWTRPATVKRLVGEAQNQTAAPVA